jgi:hypothetical protein
MRLRPFRTVKFSYKYVDISLLKVRVVIDKIELDDDPKLANVLRTQQHVREMVGLVNTLLCRNKLYQYSYMTVPNQKKFGGKLFYRISSAFPCSPIFQYTEPILL